MFGKNDWLIKIRYTGSGSKKMNAAAAAAALLSVCLCVRKEKKKKGGKRARPTYLAGQIIIKNKKDNKEKKSNLDFFVFLFSYFFTGSCLSLNSHRGENNESLFELRLVRYADFLTLRNDSNTFFQ
jgi:hypothetical protein